MPNTREVPGPGEAPESDWGSEADRQSAPDSSSQPERSSAPGCGPGTAAGAEQRRPSAPARLAAPLLGTEGAARFARPDARVLVAGSWMVLAVLGLSVAVGILLQAPCMSGGYELPRASFRMCSSPVALSLLGETAPDAPGAITSGLPGFSLLTYWFTVAASGLLGAAPAEGMAILLVLNTAAFAAMGTGMLVLARKLGLGGRGPAWAAVGFLSPVIVFGIGASLEPVGVACAVWACVLLLGGRTTGSLLGAGSLLAVAAAAGPLGLVVLLGVLLGASRDRAQAALVLAGFALLTGLMLLADGRLPGRLAVWFSDAVDRGSLASIALVRGWSDEAALTTGLLVVWGFGLVALAALFVSRSMHRPVRTAPEAASPGAAPTGRAGSEASPAGATVFGAGGASGAAPAAASSSPAPSSPVSFDLATLREMEASDERIHLRRTALTLTAMLSFSVIVAPGSSTSLSLWLVPFAALMVPHLWVHAVWFFAELGFAIAAHLSEAAALDAQTGLADSWAAVFTLLRFLALALITAYALDDLVRRPPDLARAGAGDAEGSGSTRGTGGARARA
ncbi:hypothetical protein [Brevibacterium album]|uniref:hypothetical protein n=1 Tax=Brevibacterium album TaxID=417948 RepID=UPI0003FBD65D|nr:hypothetical protein [Brevibacterium album]